MWEGLYQNDLAVAKIVQDKMQAAKDAGTDIAAIVFDGDQDTEGAPPKCAMNKFKAEDAAVASTLGLTDIASETWYKGEEFYDYDNNKCADDA
jgi:hypothetical protein